MTPGYATANLDSAADVAARFGMGEMGEARFLRIVEVAARDVLYCAPSVMREWEAGPDGLHMLAFGGHAEADNEGRRDSWID